LTGGALFLVLLFGGLLLVAYFAGTSRDMGDLGGARIMILADSNNEILDEDAAAKTIHYRNKKTGEEFLVRLDPATNQVKREPVNAVEPANGPSK
jgi:hypothetical protein